MQFMKNMFENDRFIRYVQFNGRIPKDSYLNSLPAVKNLEKNALNNYKKMLKILLEDK